MEFPERKPLVVRALEIAPYCHNNKAVRFYLKNEGYCLRDIDATFQGKSLRRQLKALRTDTPSASTIV